MATSDLISGGNIEPRGLEEDMRSSYLDYSMSVIVGRALPDVRDGLKPVHRRVLFSMNENGLQPNRSYAKSARIVGDVMGKYHPHGDTAIYDTLVRMAQDFSMRNMLVDGQGNFGSLDDDPAAAMRYTEARLAPIAREMLRDLDADTVDFQPNYDGQNNEPVVLPARFPNLLVNGSSGTAVGMATNIPPHNLRETIAATIAYIDDPDIDTAGLMQHIKGPDFPTGGMILGLSGIRDAYETGRGRIRVRAKVHIEEGKQGKDQIVVTELPYMVKKGGEGGLIRKIADLHSEKKLTEITNIEDHSDRKGMRVVIELKRDVNPKVVLNKLYKHTQMQTTFGVNTVALVDNVPRTLPLRGVIHFYVQHQREVIVRRSKHELRVQQLTALEADSLRREHADLVERIRELRELLGDEDKVLALIKEELLEIADRYGDDRRTKIAPAEDDLDIEDLIADQQMVISITNSSYIKSLPLATYRQQRRGGVGIIGMDMKDEDFIEHLFVCSTHDYLLFFTNRGKVYRSKVYDLPEAGRTSKGRYLGNVLPLREGERVQSVLATRDFSETKYLAFGSRGGIIKKTEFQLYNTPIKADGIIAINIRDDDELVAVRRVDEGDEILMVSHEGLAVRFKEESVRAQLRPASGVRGMDVSGKGNYVLAMDVARPGQDLLVITEAGYGKRTGVDEYRLTSRGTKGVKTISFTEAKGLLAAALVVREHEDLVFISQNGMVQRTGVRGINRYGRASQGVRVMNLREGDEVSAVALVVETEAPPEGAPAGQPISLDASGMADDAVAQGDVEGVISSDPVDEPDIVPDEAEPHQ